MAFKFILLEGIDGCGKQTQAERLKELLRRRHERATIHKYPTQKAGDALEHLQGKQTLSADQLFERFSQDILQDQPTLADALRKGWVIVDRYCVSTAAYQGVGGTLQHRVDTLGETPWIKPDAILWLDAPVEEAMRRKAGQKTPDRHERDKSFLEAVRTNYEQLYRNQFLSKRWHRIDAAQEADKVAEDIRKALEL